MSNRAVPSQVWRMRIDGTEPVQITKRGGYLPLASADGKFLYYSKGSQIWRVPADGGEEVPLALPKISSFLNFTLTRDAIYYIPDSTPGTDDWIERFDLAKQTTQKVLNISSGPGFTFSPDSHLMFSRAGLSLSPDGRILVWAQSDQAGSDIVLTKVK